MLTPTVVFSLVGLLTGVGALLLFPGGFAVPRLLTVGTGVVAALVGGLICRVVLPGSPLAGTAAAAVTAAALVSVLARPAADARPAT